MQLEGKHLCIPVVLVVLTGAATAQSWSDDMEAYAPGSTIEGQGGWTAWDGLTTNFTVASTAQARARAQTRSTSSPASILAAAP